jgi:hypothetical protein
MYLGKTLSAQAMDFLPWKTFHRIVNRYGGDHRTRSLSCAEQFRVMAFAQLTYRESLRDIAHLRRIRYRDPERGKDPAFLTNQFALPALTICALYRCRWQVELFFEWIKQHLRIKHSMALPTTLCGRKYGSPSASTCWSRSSRRNFVSTCPCIHCYRSCRHALREIAIKTSCCGRRAAQIIPHSTIN